MFNPHTYQNSSTSGAAFMEIVQRRDDTAQDREPVRWKPVFMSLLGTHLSGTISGPVTRLQISHRFGQPEGIDLPVLEAVYRFPLPGDAAVTAVEVTFGDTRIRAELARREEAEQEYDRARATGHQAILLTRESPDVFSLHISGIEPGQEVSIVTDFVKSLTPEGTSFSLRIPLTPAPRYVSDLGRGGRHEHGQPLDLAHDPGHRFSLDLQVFGCESVSSWTHQLNCTYAGDATIVSLSEGEVVPDRDLVLHVAVTSHVSEPSLQVFRYGPEAGEHEYFLALVTPPEVPQREQKHPREIILLIDRSGSMTGPKWEAADWAVRRFLSGLTPEDHFSIGLFHSDTRWFSRVSVPATDENVTAAQAFVDAYDDSGGTELERALEEAITCGRASGELSRHIVIITDAQVSNARGNLALARAESERSNRRRISMLCIDAAPNSWLVHEMVAIGGGHASFLTSDPEQEDIATALDDIMEFWDQPIETGLTLSVNRSDVWVMGKPVNEDGEREIVDLGDLPAGKPIWIAGRCARSEAPLVCQLAGPDGSVISRAEEIIESDKAIAAVFGARRLATLEFQLEPSSRRSRWHQRHIDNVREVKEQLIAESLRYGLICSETSFVAVREEAGKLVQRGAVVPNALPFGWSDEFVAYSMAPAAHPPARERANYLESDVRYSLNEMSSGQRPFDRLPANAEYRQEHDSGGVITLFEGVPDVSTEELVLFETSRFGKSGRLKTLKITVEGDDSAFDGELVLYTGRGDEPRARVRLRDVLNQGGDRPLNIRVSRIHPVRLVLRNATRIGQAPRLKIELVWD